MATVETQETAPGALIAIPAVPPAELFESGIDPLIDEVRNAVADFKPDVSTKAGRDKIASMAYAVARSKTLVDELGKKVVEEQSNFVKAVNAKRKHWRDTLDEIKGEVRAPLDEFERAEELRVNEHNMRLLDLRALRDQTDSFTLEQLEARLAQLDELMKRDWQEFAENAEGVATVARVNIEKAIEARKKYDAEQAELAELRAKEEQRQREEAARAQKEREEQIAREAEERAKAEAEARAKAEAERVEREKREAEEAHKREQERLEREKQEAEARAEARIAQAAQEERERIEAEKAAEELAARKRQEDAKHKRAIEAEILKAFVSAGMAQKHAAEAVGALLDGKIPHVTINY